MYDKSVYAFADKQLAQLRRKIIRLFGRLPGLTAFDELNVMRNVRAMYEELYDIVRESYLLIAENAYTAERKQSMGAMRDKWLEEMLVGYNPVTQYVFDNEYERKMYRCAESLIAATGNRKSEAERARNLLYTQVSEYAVQVTDAARAQAFADMHVEKARWVTQRDRKVCHVCEARDGHIYLLSKVPSKPHPRCRCYIESVRDDKRL